MRTDGVSEERGGKRPQHQRSERVERPFAHQFETGGLRQIFVRGHANVSIAATGIGLRIRAGALDVPPDWDGARRSLQGRVAAAIGTQTSRWRGYGGPVEAFLDVGSARFVDLRARIPSLRYLNVNVRTEH